MLIYQQYLKCSWYKEHVHVLFYVMREHDSLMLKISGKRYMSSTGTLV